MICRKILIIFLYIFIINKCFGDIYMHNPRGSNNRLNEKRATRQTNNRLFDSQNNARGGYNTGDATKDPAGNDEKKQYQMKYFQSANNNDTDSNGKSFLEITWTNQHGAGETNQKLNSNFVIQCMCQPDIYTSDTNEEKYKKRINQIRDGVQPHRQHFSNANSKLDKYENDVKWKVQDNRGLHEPHYHYQLCKKRNRNKGLFTADQNVNGNDATRTRQNPNGNQNGYECPEERDYYPYWHPTPWKDIAIITSHSTQDCETYKSESFNVKSRFMCIQQDKVDSEYNNKEECEANNHIWQEFHNYLEIAEDVTDEATCEADSNRVWGVPYGFKRDKKCLVKLKEPDCVKAEFTRVNHLGNANSGDLNDESEEDLKTNRYTWKIPHFSQNQRCVLRIRYNISTDDYNPRTTFSEYNEDNLENEDDQLITNDPKVQIGIDLFNKPTKFQLAINTAQFGRTFQDRSHTFILCKREGNNIGDDHINKKIYNLNVRGKRGNIVQTFPAVEYDFVPNRLKMKEDDLLHIQWTGSNTHDNDPPGGDGQTGDDGEGAGGTDRHNVLGLGSLDSNYPLPFEKKEDKNLFQNVEVIWNSITPEDGQEFSQKDIALQYASSGFFHCFEENVCGDKALNDNDKVLNNKLNNAPASFQGSLLKIDKGTYYIVCTRNNNFSNRSQKGTIIVEE